MNPTDNTNSTPMHNAPEGTQNDTSAGGANSTMATRDHLARVMHDYRREFESFKTYLLGRLQEEKKEYEALLLRIQGAMDYQDSLQRILSKENSTGINEH